jgi:hypothetical protein
MPITKALEFDQTPNRLLFQIGEEARQQRALQQKLELDEARKRAEVFNEINPATLYGKFEKEVVSRKLDGLTAAAADYIKRNPNSSSNDFRAFINKEVSSMATQSAKIKAVKDNIKNTVGALGKDSIYDIPALNALALDRALYKTDQFGNKVLKEADEIDETEDFLTNITRSDPDKVISKVAGANALNAKIKDASLFEQSITTEVDTPSGRQTIITGRESKLPFYLQADDKGNVGIKTQKNGYIDEDVFQQFYQDPAVAVYVDANAKDIMKQAGVPESPEATEYFKRSFLTDFLERNKKGAIDLVDKKLYAKAPAAGAGSGAPKEPPVTVDVYSDIVDAVDTGRQVTKTQGTKVIEQFGAPLTDVPQSAREIILSNVNKVAQFKGADEDQPRDYTQEDVTLRRKDANTIGVYEYPSGKFLTDIAKLDVNVKASGAIGGQKSKVEAAKQSKAKTIKRSDIAGKAGDAGYTPAEYEKLLVQKGIQIID